MSRLPETSGGGRPDLRDVRDKNERLNLELVNLNGIDPRFYELLSRSNILILDYVIDKAQKENKTIADERTSPEDRERAMYNIRDDRIEQFIDKFYGTGEIPEAIYDEIDRRLDIAREICETS